ncbi:Alkaline phosphatase like protein [hydrothermal vent metagenome]|uniref:Alkaline phosphatase like protein n=1 Tax=hydrothermal vent metagenome TaxID=652676 RepID=A0A1W1C5B2_9ZZZZ
MIEQFASQLVAWIFDLGYIGIFSLMAIESSFIPFPSEVVLIPAGYLAFKGEMSIPLILLFAILGSLVGALINYYIAMHLGRRFILRYGKYFFISEETLEKLDAFFKEHGHISTFTGRLIPGIRQLISIPAGIAKMDLREFCIYTALGAGIWALVLILLGYFIGQEQTLIKHYLREITIITLFMVSLLLVWYYKRKKRS